MTEQTAHTAAAWTDHRVELVVGNLLRTGVLLAAAVVAIGAVIYLVHHGGEKTQYGTFHGEPERLRSVPAIVEEGAALHGRGIIQTGLLLLIATPIARVALAAFAFGRQRDWLYVAVSLIVLGLLCLSLSGVLPA